MNELLGYAYFLLYHDPIGFIIMLGGSYVIAFALLGLFRRVLCRPLAPFPFPFSEHLYPHARTDAAIRTIKEQIERDRAAALIDRVQWYILIKLTAVLGATWIGLIITWVRHGMAIGYFD